ncbi:MAG: S-layer homology domain-containing protein [Clostridia bacterium]|nr:S-layer homology domain-containing protein [Clostridia bacterium]
MKRFKRIISLALAAFLTLTALVTVTNATQFTDVPSTAPLLDAINYAVDNNFIEPTSSTTFSPNSYMTRGNMVLMLYRHSGETASSTNTGFTDVPSSSVYARAVVWAVTNEITNGTSSTTFEPSTNIKRQDAAVLMYRYAQYMVHRTDYTSTLEDFTDSGRVQSYALPAMQWAVGAGIIRGTTSTTLEPRVALKRGAAAAMLQRYGFSVESLKYSRDVYSFGNNSSFFRHLPICICII